MKELTIEEKAQRYDKALTKARTIVNSINVGLIGKDSFEAVFPELKENREESTDEKVRQALVKLVTNHASMDLFIKYDIHLDEALSWLEKQGEHAKFRDSIQVGDKITRNQDGVLVNLSQLKRVANKVKPKFKIGDWIIDSRGDTLHIISVKEDYYIVENPYVRVFNFDRASVDLSCRLWTIQDAKDGDVIYLPTGDNEYYFFIFKGIENAAVMSFAHFYQYNDGTSEVEGTIDNLSSVDDVFQPATKEQHDLLFQKIHEAGYVWDAEKKKLRKTVTPIFHIGDRIRYKGHKCDGVITEITDTDYICGNTELPISTQDKLELVK